MPGVVLVVDDNRISRELMHRRLVRQGYEVVVAESGNTALEAIQLHPIDLVLLDLQMPDMSGQEVLRQLRKTFPPLQLPVMMVSSSDDTPSMIRCIEDGATDYLTKPVQFGLLFAKIRQHLQLKPRSLILPASSDFEYQPPPALDCGDSLAHYLLQERLGQGGMGSVFRAQDLRLLRSVALKLIHHEPKPGVALERFLTEARALARVDHPGVVRIFEIGLEPCRFLAMELVEGAPLDEALQGQSVATIVDAFVQLLEALEAIHLQGIVHRDLKPGNALCTRDGKVKLMDFGLARTAELDPMGGDSLYGTPQYMAPEAFQSSLGRVDAQSDLFAVAVMLFEILTGQLPFRSTSLGDLITSVTQEPPLGLLDVCPELPESLARVLSDGLERDKSLRFATARQFAQALRTCLSEES